MDRPVTDRPFVGIACGQQTTSSGTRWTGVSRDYVRAIEAAGGVPVLIPIFEDLSLAGPYVSSLDGLLLAGGGDVDPALFNEDPQPELGDVDPERDAIDIALARHVLERDIPVLAICRGIQVLNVAAGGTLYQDVPTQVPRAIKHDQSAPRWYPCHDVRLEADSLMAKVYRTDALRVNSFHHQAVRVVAPSFRVAAKAKDAVVEGLESREHRFAVGVQWHPECMYDHYPVQRLLFSAFINACRSYRAAAPSGGETHPRAVVTS